MSPFFYTMLTFSNQHELYTAITHMQSQSQPGSPFFSHTILHGIFMCSPAGPAEKNLSTIFHDIRITVSFSHQISHHIQMIIPAVFKHLQYTTQCSPTLTCMSTELHTQALWEEKTFILVVKNSELHTFTYCFSLCTW